MRSAVNARLKAAGYQTGNYRNIGYYPGGGGFGSHAAVGGKWFVASSNGGSTLHEMGHNFTFGHQNAWKQEAGDGPLENGTFANKDVFHFMSGTSSIAPSATAPEPFEKWNRNWITDRHVVNENGSKTVRLYTFDQKETDEANSKRTLMVDRRKGADGQIWAGYRSKLLKGNEALRQGLSMYWRRNGSGSSALIDAHPWTGSGPHGLDNHALQPGETWSDDPGDVFITNLGRGGDGPNEYLDILINRGDFSDNEAPDPTWDAPLNWLVDNELTISVDGNDPDGDDIYGMWLSSDRDIAYNTSADHLTLSWDTPGVYKVQVLVSDAKGHSVWLRQDINVRSVPEPHAIFVLSSCLLGLAFKRRRLAKPIQATIS